MTGILFAGFAWAQGDAANDPIKTLVGRLDLAHYKATIKALAKFGDRRENTDRNRAAVDWIEAQLKSYGCTNTERIHYEWTPFIPPQSQARFPAAVGGGVIKGELGSRLGPDDNADVQPDPRLRQHFFLGHLPAEHRRQHVVPGRARGEDACGCYHWIRAGLLAGQEQHARRPQGQADDQGRLEHQGQPRVPVLPGAGQKRLETQAV